MATNVIFERVIDDGVTQNTAGSIGAAKTSGKAFVAMYAVFGAGTSAGVVTLETAPYSEFTGTWASMGTATWSVANDVKYVRADGPVGAIRARISTAITGGSVDVYLLAGD